MAASLIGSLAVNLVMETAAFLKGVDYSQKAAKKLGGELQNTGKKIAAVGGAMSVAITAPLVAFGKSAFQAASDAQELQSAFNETFGGMAGEMNEWAEATGNAMQRSTREIQEGAQTFGLYFMQAAKTRQEAAKMSQTFTVLAQDMASFHNTSGEEAIAALRSGLSGESEPLRRFGVFLSEAAVNAKAAELGIGSLGGKLTDQEKIMARYALIMEATKNAQGDVARTSSSTANQLKASQAAWEEMSITIGTKLLPALTPLITALTKVLDKFNTLSPGMQTFIVGAAAAAAAIGPITLGIGGLVTGIGALMPVLAGLATFLTATLIPAAVATAPIWGPIALAIAAVGAAIYGLIKFGPMIHQFGKDTRVVFDRMVADIKAAVIDRLNKIWEDVKAKIEWVKRQFYDLYDAVVGNSYVPDMIDGIAREMGRLQQVMVDPALSATDKVAGAFSSLGSIIGSIFGHKAGGIVSTIGQVFSLLSGSTGGFGGGSGSMPNVFGMYRGGGFTVGGRGGLDRNLLSVNGSPVANVSRGERVNVVPAGGEPSAATKIFDLRGAMVTADLIDELDRRADAKIIGAAPTFVSAARNAVMRDLRRPRL